MKLTRCSGFLLLIIIVKGNIEDEMSNVVKVYGKNGKRTCNYGINDGKLGTLTWRLIDQLEKRKSMGEKFRKALNNCGPNTKNRPKSCQSKIVQSFHQRYFGNTKSTKYRGVMTQMRELKKYRRKIDKCIKGKKPCRRLECVIDALYGDCFGKKKSTSSCLAKISNPKLPSSAERKIIAATTYFTCNYLMKVGQCTVNKKSRYQPACTKKVHRVALVANGHTAMKNAWPWTVAINTNNGYHCAGSLIHNRLVLTAAHCVEDQKISELTVVTGEHTRQWTDEGEKKIGVEYYYLHKMRVDEDRYDYDIAVLKLKSSNKNKKVAQPICLGTNSMVRKQNKRHQLGGWNCFVAGWGEDEKGHTSRELRQASVPVWSHDRCYDVYREYMEFDNSSILCTGTTAEESKRIGACSGDSGGPLHCTNDDERWYLVGFVVGGDGNKCLTDMPSAMASVPYFYNFYSAVIKRAERLSLPKFKNK